MSAEKIATIAEVRRLLAQKRTGGKNRWEKGVNCGIDYGLNLLAEFEFFRPKSLVEKLRRLLGVEKAGEKGGDG
jgi:hypothetical protein